MGALPEVQVQFLVNGGGTGEVGVEGGSFDLKAKLTAPACGVIAEIKG